MPNKVNRSKALILMVTVVVSGFVLTPTSLAADDDNDCTQVCNQVFTDAQKLPSPDWQSIKDYGSTLTKDIGNCLQCGVDKVTQSAPDNSQSSSSSDSSSGGDDGGN